MMQRTTPTPRSTQGFTMVELLIATFLTISLFATVLLAGSVIVYRTLPPRRPAEAD